MERVLCAGDSLTMGSPGWRGSYRRHLGNMAPNLIFMGTETTFNGNDGYGNHQGYSGGTIAARGPAILSAIDTFDPTTVLIWFGANEITLGIEDVDVLYNFAIDCTKKSSVERVVVGTCAPRKSTAALYVEQNAYRSAINTHFQITQSPLPSGLFHCDPGAVIGDEDFFDSVHLTDAGYAKTAVVWHEALRNTGAQLHQIREGAGQGVMVF